ncbi:hypothetical protein NC653_016529 [Populus alba x Populus x berolinensis]|uniref:Uncharacterized protein n=1 Tax=Populus alba x Populus x berolinensis TaxID=444605 RepID=A0AAD6VZI1_9ROSI|nr:hypothetical protein NC653_016529 [Populus alba x Populus x berolinensis]
MLKVHFTQLYTELFLPCFRITQNNWLLHSLIPILKCKPATSCIYSLLAGAFLSFLPKLSSLMQFHFQLSKVPYPGDRFHSFCLEDYSFFTLLVNGMGMALLLAKTKAIPSFSVLVTGLPLLE